MEAVVRQTVLIGDFKAENISREYDLTCDLSLRDGFFPMEVFRRPKYRAFLLCNS